MIAEERDTPRVQWLRRQYELWQRGAPVGRLFCIDETGSTIAMTRTHGRSPRGQPVVGRVPRRRGTVITVIGALTVNGLTAMMTIEGATTGDVFLTYVNDVLGPELRPGDVVVLDNLGAHKDHRVRAAIEARGAKLVFQPPYSPDKNPIELAWAWLKSFLRTAGARTLEAVDIAIAFAMDMVDENFARAWFRHCGFSHQAQ